jgi:VanZ family protein
MSSPAVPSPSFLRVAQVLAWALTVTIVILTIVPPFLRPVTGAPHNFEHFAMFLLTGAAFGVGYPWREYILCILAILFSAIVELSQLVVPGRHARLGDFVVDALGACAGVVFASLFLSRRRSAKVTPKK